MTATPRYRALADHVAALVVNGTLAPGARAPSLRAISRQRRVSLSTAIAAYRLLEDRGVLEARPQSGFYVAGAAASSLAPPAMSEPPGTAIPVAMSGAFRGLLMSAADPRLLATGCAVPSTEVLAAGRLDRHLARAARTRGADYNLYTTPKGDPALRGEIARRAMRWGQALSPGDIAVTCGCTEALTLALRATTRPGDTVAIESPTYFGVLQALEALGLQALELPTDPKTGVDVAALERALDRRRVAACVLASSFNNPLGCTIPEDRKRDVLAVLARHRVPLIEDDVYGDIAFGAERPRPFMALVGDAPDAPEILYCSSFSKTLAPGYRVGWIVTRSRMDAVLDHKLASTLSGAALPQAAVADFLVSGGYDGHLRRIRRIFRESLDRMRLALERHFPAGTRASRPRGGFVVWVELPEAVDTRRLFERALANGICFAPGDVFSASGRYRHCLRLSCGHVWDARTEDGVATLGRMACEAAGVTPR